MTFFRAQPHGVLASSFLVLDYGYIPCTKPSVIKSSVLRIASETTVRFTDAIILFYLPIVPEWFV